MMTLSLTFVNFTTSGLTYWITSYFQTILKTTEKWAQIAVAITCITGPVGGLVVSSTVDAKRNSYLVILIFAIFGGIVSMIAPFLNQKYQAVGAFWCVMFVGGILCPKLFLK
jgi:hypothetical protein